MMASTDGRLQVFFFFNFYFCFTDYLHLDYLYGYCNDERPSTPHTTIHHFIWVFFCTWVSHRVTTTSSESA
jgi:hypothetical protein